jgi:hypothetical protein
MGVMGQISNAVKLRDYESSSVGAARKGFTKIPKGFKEVKDFGYQHGQKVYEYKGKYYSRDIDSHNGGAAAANTTNLGDQSLPWISRFNWRDWRSTKRN